MNVYDAKRRAIYLGESVGRGGEAAVYRVRGQTGWLAKIYEPGPRPNYQDKLAWMVGHPPENPTRSIAHYSLAWPSGLLYDSKRKLAGYLMPYIHSAVPVLEVFNPRRRQATLPRFDQRYLHRTARNLSATLAALHNRGYMVGDLNESNVLITPSALITIIDTDSFQVPEARGDQIVYHPCPVGKLEYTPPELQNRSIGSVVRQPEHDFFALGVLIFQLLMNGNHPFRAQWLGSSDPPPIETRIAQGNFPYTTSPSSLVRPPKGAPDLNLLHPALVELALRCFIDGHNDPQIRPSPEQWERALVQAENAIVQCPNHHLYSNHLTRCPTCQASTQSTTSQAGARKSTQDASATPKPRETWRGPNFKGPQPAATSQQTAKPPPAKGPQPAAASQQTAKPPPAAGQSPRANPTRPRPVYRGRQAAPAIDWRSLIASLLNNPWPQPAYPSWASPQARPAPPPPSRPNPSSQPLRSPVYRQASLWSWAKPRLSKSLVMGGGLGALIGMLIGAAAGMASASLNEMAAWALLWALGGAAAGVLRGWKPGYQMSVWVNRHIGWHRVFPALGLLAGAIGGMLTGIFIGWWAILPVFIGLVTGARLGKSVGHKIAALGNRIGWERIWAGISATCAALIGWQVAAWLGGGAVGGLASQGAGSLAGLLTSSTPSILVTALITGALAGGLGGAISGSLTDIVARFSGLID